MLFLPLTGLIEIGFSELDQTESEGTGMIRIVLEKSGTNMGAVEVLVEAIRYDELHAHIPEELVTRGLPDPAECKHCR